MIKKAIEYIIDISKPTISQIENETYSDKPLYRVSFNPKADAITLHTLTSLVDYITSYVDSFDQKMIIHVVSPTVVEMYSGLDKERKREKIVRVEASVPIFTYGKFMNHGEFLIGVQSKFVDDPGTDKKVLLKFAGTVESGSVSEYGDDGVTQKATVKTGIASKSDAIVPSPCVLVPYRTFNEVEQPGSSFIFRMKDDKYEGVMCALFEADGGAWKNEAMKNIKEYLEKELENYSFSFVVIA